MLGQLGRNKPTSVHPDAASAGQSFSCHHLKREKGLSFPAESTIDAPAVEANRAQKAADWENRAICSTFLLSEKLLFLSSLTVLPTLKVRVTHSPGL